MVLTFGAKALNAWAGSSRKRSLDPQSARYDFRVFLLQLGLIGDEFKTEGKHLLAAEEGELQVLVDRLWPRGVRKQALGGIRWMPEVAPSAALRRWYGHDPARWEEFRRRYFAELDARPQAAAPLLDAARRDRLLLLTASRDLARSNAAALADWLQRRLAEEGGGA